MRWPLTLLGPVLMLFACQSRPAVPQGISADDRDEIRALLDAQKNAWNAGDLERYMAGYHQSPEIVFTSGGRVRRGFDESLSSYRKRYQEGDATMGVLDFTDLELTSLGPNAALAMGRFELTETEHAGGGVFSLVLLRKDGSWGVWHDHTSADANPPPPARRVAVTIDDLPLADFDNHAGDAERLAAVTAICDGFKARNIPVVGFVNMAKHESQPQLMEAWRDCGVTLGNHTWSHKNADEVPLDEYLADLRKGDEALRDFLGSDDPVYFRYPYLRRGKTRERRGAIEVALETLDSTAVPVTIDTWDWLYNAELHEAGMDDLNARQGWMWNVQERTLEAERVGAELFGYEPPQILLIHANAINGEALPHYFDWLESRGYRFVSVHDAMADRAYAEVDESLSPTGDAWWLRIRRSRSLDQPATAYPVLAGH